VEAETVMAVQVPVVQVAVAVVTDFMAVAVAAV
jgi:hypothetical protein